MTLMLDARRKAMLKAAGIDVWWQTVEVAKQRMQAHPAQSNAQLPAREQPTPPLMQTASHQQQAVAVAGEKIAPLAAHRAEADPSLFEQPAASKSVIGAPYVGSDAAKAAVLPRNNVMPAQWGFSGAAPIFKEVQQETTQALANWLFITDHFPDLGEQAQVAAQALFENMLKAMGLMHSPYAWQATMRSLDASSEVAIAQPQDLLAAVKPKVVVAMGRVASQVWLQTSEPLGALREQVHMCNGVAVIATYSPSYLLRSSHAKAGAWVDLRRAMALAAAK